MLRNGHLKDDFQGTAHPPVLFDGKCPHSFFGRYSIENGKADVIAHVEVDERVGVFWLTNLWVDPDHRGKGHAIALMCTAVAAWSHCDLYLAVQPYTDQALSADTLARFYASYGFTMTTVPGIMHRSARPWAGRVEEVT